jgi:hypothetical protein
MAVKQETEISTRAGEALFKRWAFESMNPAINIPRFRFSDDFEIEDAGRTPHRATEKPIS